MPLAKSFGITPMTSIDGASFGQVPILQLVVDDAAEWAVGRADKMTISVCPLGVLAACLACHAIAQAGDDDTPPHGMVIRTVAHEQTPVKPRLRLDVGAWRGPRLTGPGAPPQRPTRVGAEFNLAAIPVNDVDHRILLRTRLSGGTHISLRARRRGIGVVLRSEF